MLETLLKHHTKSEFLENSFLRLPYAEPGGCLGVVEASGWDILASVLADPAGDVMVVKAGERWAESRLPSLEEARKLYSEGYTLLARHAERQHAELAELAEQFAKELSGEVDVHLYCTPGSAFGFGWHYDVEDVFLLQLAGEKEYSIRKNTVNPWPILENMPQDLRYERELMPLMKCNLAAGDWLYIPHGYWHMGEAKTDSITLAIGVMMTTALDVLDYARKRLVDSIRWRQRLPVSMETETSSQAFFAELGEELKTLFSDPAFARQFFAARQEALQTM